MASKFPQTSTVTVTEPTITKAPVKPVATSAPVATSVPVVESNSELEKRVEALEKKVDDLIARLSRKMSF